MNAIEQAVSFTCEGETLQGVLSLPAESGGDVGVVVVVGGPQYRAGSHRQFVALARSLANAGVPALRFDYRGMGDSSGELRNFEHVTADIGEAINALTRAEPSVRRIVLWGLCDGASAALLYCRDRSDPRVCGLCLLNPWVRSDASLARAQVKHYYTDRIRQKSFWLKLLSGRVALGAIKSLLRNLQLMRQQNPDARENHSAPRFQDRMAQAWQSPASRILLILSGKDYTAKEFIEYVARDPHWKVLLQLPHVTRHDIEAADHTFSNTSLARQVEEITIDWINADRCDRANSTVHHARTDQEAM